MSVKGSRALSGSVANAVTDELVIALDFGTTYSGIAWAYSNEPDEVNCITTWPGGEGRSSPKTPTVLKYDPGSSTNFRWGFDVDQRSEDCIKGLKLMFDPGQRRPYRSDHDALEASKLPKDVKSVAADYMKALYRHAWKIVTSNTLSPEFIDQYYKKRYVLTVPAVWSDKAKQLTQEAAELADINPVSMITEPEAAALYTIESMKYKGLEKNDVIIICDAGGGTVDLISYQVAQLHPLKLRALTSPTGAVAGSLLLNKNFENEVRMTVGDDVFASLRKTKAYLSALREFDSTVKLEFRGKNDPQRYITFPMAKLQDNLAMGLERDAMVFSGSRLAKLFQPITTEITRLVKEQADAAIASSRGKQSVKAVFMVGGLGSSAYLKEVLEGACPGLVFVQPPDAWQAIVKGAAMSQVTSKNVVISTKAAKSYGVYGRSRWDPERDAGQPKVWSEWSEEYKCSTMTWFISKGCELERSQKVSHGFRWNFQGHNPTGKDLIQKEVLYECSNDKPPVHWTEDVGFNCRLTVDLSKVPKMHFQKLYRESDEEPFCRLEYQLLIENNESGLMRYSVEVAGTEYAAVYAKY